MKQRLESLDALRGFDLFCLVALSGLVEELAEVACRAEAISGGMMPAPLPPEAFVLRYPDKIK